MSRIGPVTADGRKSSPALLAAVAGSAAAAREAALAAGRTAMSAGARWDAQSALVGTCLPTAVKRSGMRLAVRLLGGMYSDTSLLTNLGNVTDPPVFGPLSPSRMWFSTSAHMPRGLSLGAISVAGKLQVCLRYRYALFSDSAATSFAAEFRAALDSLTALMPGRPGA